MMRRNGRGDRKTTAAPMVLPPSVKGKLYGRLKIIVDELVWWRKPLGTASDRSSGCSRSGITVKMQWWGSDKPILFRPIDVSEHTFKLSSKDVCDSVYKDSAPTCHVFDIRTNFQLFDRYLKNCESLLFYVSDDKHENIIGTVTIKNIYDVIKFDDLSITKNCCYYPILNKYNNRVGDLRVCFCVIRMVNNSNNINKNEQEVSTKQSKPIKNKLFESSKQISGDKIRLCKKHERYMNQSDFKKSGSESSTKTSNKVLKPFVDKGPDKATPKCPPNTARTTGDKELQTDERVLSKVLKDGGKLRNAMLLSVMSDLSEGNGLDNYLNNIEYIFKGWDSIDSSGLKTISNSAAVGELLGFSNSEGSDRFFKPFEIEDLKHGSKLEASSSSRPNELVLNDYLSGKPLSSREEQCALETLRSVSPTGSMIEMAVAIAADGDESTFTFQQTNKDKEEDEKRNKNDTNKSQSNCENADKKCTCKCSCCRPAISSASGSGTATDTGNGEVDVIPLPLHHHQVKKHPSALHSNPSSSVSSTTLSSEQKTTLSSEPKNGGDGDNSEIELLQNINCYRLTIEKLVLNENGINKVTYNTSSCKVNLQNKEANKIGRNNIHTISSATSSSTNTKYCSSSSKSLPIAGTSLPPGQVYFIECNVNSGYNRTLKDQRYSSPVRFCSRKCVGNVVFFGHSSVYKLTCIHRPGDVHKNFRSIYDLEIVLRFVLNTEQWRVLWRHLNQRVPSSLGNLKQIKEVHSSTIFNLLENNLVIPIESNDDRRQIVGHLHMKLELGKDKMIFGLLLLGDKLLNMKHYNSVEAEVQTDLITSETSDDRSASSDTSSDSDTITNNNSGDDDDDKSKKNEIITGGEDYQCHDYCKNCRSRIQYKRTDSTNPVSDFTELGGDHNISVQHVSVQPPPLPSHSLQCPCSIDQRLNVPPPKIPTKDELFCQQIQTAGLTPVSYSDIDKIAFIHEIVINIISVTRCPLFYNFNKNNSDKSCNKIAENFSCYIEYTFPFVNPRVSSKNSDRVIVVSGDFFRTYSTGVVDVDSAKIIPRFNYEYHHRLATQDDVLLQDALKSYDVTANDVTFSLWLRFYHPKPRDHIIANALLPVSELYNLQSKHIPGSSSTKVIELPLKLLPSSITANLSQNNCGQLTILLNHYTRTKRKPCMLSTIDEESSFGTSRTINNSPSEFHSHLESTISENKCCCGGKTVDNKTNCCHIGLQCSYTNKTELKDSETQTIDFCHDDTSTKISNDNDRNNLFKNLSKVDDCQKFKDDEICEEELKSTDLPKIYCSESYAITNNNENTSSKSTNVLEYKDLVSIDNNTTTLNDKINKSTLNMDANENLNLQNENNNTRSHLSLSDLNNDDSNKIMIDNVELKAILIKLTELERSYNNLKPLNLIYKNYLLDNTTPFTLLSGEGCSNKCNDHKSNDLLKGKTISDQLTNDDDDDDLFKCKIEIERALHLPLINKKTSEYYYLNKISESCTNEDLVGLSSCVKISFLLEKNNESDNEGLLNSCNIVTAVVKNDSNPFYNATFDTAIPRRLLYNKVMFLRLFVHRVDEFQHLLVQPIGIATVKFNVFSKGFFPLRGWFHLFNHVGRCTGQIKVNVTPLSDDRMPVCLSSLSSVDDVLSISDKDSDVGDDKDDDSVKLGTSAADANCLVASDKMKMMLNNVTDSVISSECLREKLTELDHLMENFKKDLSLTQK